MFWDIAQWFGLKYNILKKNNKISKKMYKYSNKGNLE